MVSGFDPGRGRRRAIRACCWRRSAGRSTPAGDRAHRAVALRGAALARHGGATRRPHARLRRAARRSRRRADADRNGMLLIEGVGGIMVPLDDSHTVLDWMMALQAAAGAGRRQLSRHHQPHADRARRAAPQRDLRVKALVVNETPQTVDRDRCADTVGRRLSTLRCGARADRRACRGCRPAPPSIRRVRQRSPRYFDASISRSVAAITRVAAFRSESLMCSSAPVRVRLEDRARARRRRARSGCRARCSAARRCRAARP